MSKLPCPKKTAPRSRCVTPAEAADETERCRRARENARQASEPTAGNLCGALVLLARWRKCCVCGSETLFTDERGRSDADFECGLCIKVREDLAKRLRYVSLAGRVRPHLTSLFTSTANDNHEARS